MNKNEREKILATLTDQQRKDVARLIRDTIPSGDYFFNGEDSVWGEDTTETLNDLAAEFERFDPESVTN